MRLASLAFVAFLAACASAPPPGSTTPRPSGRVAGVVLFEARNPTFRGVSLAKEDRPARFVTVVGLDRDGHELASTITDDQGGFAFDGRVAVARVRVVATVRHDDFDLAVCRDPNGREPHSIEVAATLEPMRILASDDTPDGPGGAFHILDTLLRGERSVRTWLGARLPPLFVYWGRGVTSEWSWFEGEVPAGSGRYKLELLGGELGRRSTTDTDEHDEAVILHEFGHFVYDRLTTASSAGGQHPSGHFVDPGLAWEEGRATWFAALVLGRSIYTDTIGVEPSGSLQAHTDLERRNPPPRGLGSQESVEEILWDLADGTPGLEDRDHDGAAIDPVAMLSAMVALGHEPNAFPCLPTYLRFLVERGLVSEADVRAVLDHGSLPEELLPTDGRTPWPFELPIGDTGRTGRIDSVSPEAPSGGPRLPHTGYDAIHTYRIAVDAPSVLELELDIDGAGDESDRTDLDLELRDLRSDEIASSRGTTHVERIRHSVDPGNYIVRVVDGGRDGARARYAIRARLTRR